MRLTETARVYELEHGLVLNGTHYHGDVKTKFKYGELVNDKNKTTVMHGVVCAQKVIEIETVRLDKVTVGDKIELVDGRKGKVTNTSSKILQSEQLRFVPYAKADKSLHITIQFI
ncbi:MAG: hypothetical protein K2M64_04130 [Clostridia bacterium]|nr:hypothetical protein [Clostridia bacterium]